jgi:hypothetical protein
MAAPLPPVWLNESLAGLPDLKSVYVSKPGLALAVGSLGVMVQWQAGTGWTVVKNQTSGPPYMSISGSAPNKMWIASGEGYVYAYDGVLPPDPRKPCGTVCTAGLTAVWTSPQGSPWVVGLGNVASRIPDGQSAWGQLMVPSSIGQNLFAVWGTSATDVWLGSGDGSAGSNIYHYTGASFQSYPVPGSLSVNGIWGQRAADVWAVGDAGLILHWTGGNVWQQVTVSDAAGLNLYSVAGNNAGEVWAVGDNGLILYYVAGKWQRSESKVLNTLYGVAVSPLDSVPIVVGTKGTILRFASPG